nr:hypothetical protein [uncultured Treponema sp.]
MKVKFLKDLNDAEKIAFEQSGLYKRIKSNWSYTDTSIGIPKCDERTACYGIGVYDRKLMTENKPLSHYVLFKSILEAKKRNCCIFEIGDVTQIADQKYNDISKFKRGFTDTLNIKNALTLKLKG